MGLYIGNIDWPKELQKINDKLDLLTLNQRLLMALVSVDQTVLDAIGAELGSIADAVQALVDDDSNDLGPADLTSVTDAVARIQDALTEPETPVDPPADPPVDETPVEEPTA